MQLSGIVKRRVDNNTLHTLHILQQDVHWVWAKGELGWSEDLQMLFAVCIRSQMHSTLR